MLTPTQKPKIVYALYRVSTKGQVDKEDIPMQKQACREFAERQGWIISKEFQEKGVSGYKVSAYDRDAIIEIRKAAEKHEFDVLLVFMFDRIGRIESETPFVVEWFYNQGIEVWSVKEGQRRFDNHFDKFVNFMTFWNAEGESIKTSERVKTRLRQLVAEGVYTGGPANFGYKLVNSGVENKRGKELMIPVIDPEEAEIVREVFEKTVADGYGSYVMADYLNKKGIRTHNGAKFQPNTINRILRNEMYIGYYNRGGVKSKRVEELVIIDDSTFKKAQKILNQRKLKNDEKRQVARFTKSSTLLAGNIYCAHCGKRLTPNSFVDKYTTKDGKKHEGSRRYRYLCTGKAMKRNSCDGQSVYTAEKVDEIVIDAVHACFEKLKSTPRDKAIEKKLKAQISEINKDIKRITKETEALKKKLEDLTAEIANALVGDSKFSQEDLSAAISITKEKIEGNNKLLTDKQELLKNSKSELDNIDVYYDEFLSWAAEFDESTLERKRMIICSLFKEISVGKGYKVDILMDTTYEQFIK